MFGYGRSRALVSVCLEITIFNFQHETTRGETELHMYIAGSVLMINGLAFLLKSNFAYRNTRNQLVFQRKKPFLCKVLLLHCLLSASRHFKLYKSAFYWSLCLLLIQQQSRSLKTAEYSSAQMWINYSSKFSSTDWEIWNRLRIADKHFLISKLTWVAWRGRNGANNRVFLCVFFDRETVASFVEYRRTLRCVDYADEDFCILCCSQSTSVDRRDVQSMKWLCPTGEHVGASHEHFSSHSIDSKNSSIVAGHDSVSNGSKTSWIGITGDDSHNRGGNGQRFTQRYVILAGIKCRPVVVNVRQLYFDHRSRAQPTCTQKALVLK